MMSQVHKPAGRDLTVGELRDAIAGLDPMTPVTVWDAGPDRLLMVESVETGSDVVLNTGRDLDEE